MVKITRLAKLFSDPSFPLHVMRIDSHEPTNALHRHDCHELVVILSGTGKHLTDTGTHPLRAGDVFLIHDDMGHGYLETDSLSLVNILFNPGRLDLALENLRTLPGYQCLFHVEPALRGSDAASSVLHLPADELARIAELISVMSSEIEDAKAGYQCMARAHFMNLLTTISRSYSHPEKRTDPASLRLGELLSFMEENYSQPITLAQLIERSHMSQTSLIRTFQRVLARAPMEHLISIRISAARQLLRGSDLTITAIAFQCGFNDSNYFSRQFKKIVGASPREFRALTPAFATKR
jgi:AraC-like DNA-binding protein